MSVFLETKNLHDETLKGTSIRINLAQHQKLHTATAVALCYRHSRHTDCDLQLYSHTQLWSAV